MKHLTETEKKNNFYLGDGLYATHDGYQYALYTDTNTVYLDEQVTEAFLYYIQRLQRQNEREKQNEQTN